MKDKMVIELLLSFALAILKILNIFNYEWKWIFAPIIVGLLIRFLILLFFLIKEYFGGIK